MLIYNNTREEKSFLMKISFLNDFFIGLYMVTDLELDPVLETETAFGIFAHFCDVLFDVAQGCEGS